MKALVVDDSRAMRMILRQILRECGFDQFAEAGHGLEALVQLEQHPDVALAVIDWNMPEMNGLELLTAMQQDSRFAHTRRLMVTTESELAQVARAVAAGADEYVMKPFTKASVMDKLRLLGLAA